MKIIIAAEIRKRIEREKKLRTTLGRVDDLNRARCYDPPPDQFALKALRDRGYLNTRGSITRKGWDFYFND